MKRVDVRRVLLPLLLLVVAVVLSGCYTEPEVIQGGTDSVYGGNVPYPVYSASTEPTDTPAPGATDSGTLVILPGADTSSTPNTGVILVTGGAQTLVPTNTPTPSPTPTATPSVLKQGASGAEVRSLQTKLKTLGYYSGTVDGDFGEATKKAVIAFQKASGLTADGVVGLKTLEKLETTKTTAKPTATPTPKATATPKVNENTYLKLGSSGAAVKTMQERLIELGYLNGVASGKFDTVTEQAVIAFQKRNVSYSDGIAGYQTLTALYKSSAKRRPHPRVSSAFRLRKAQKTPRLSRPCSAGSRRLNIITEASTAISAPPPPWRLKNSNARMGLDRMAWRAARR